MTKLRISLYIFIIVIVIGGIFLRLKENKKPIPEQPVPVQLVPMNTEVAKEVPPEINPKPILKKIQNDSVMINANELKISWILDSTPIPECNLEKGFVRACYSETSHTIFISQDITAKDKDFILYHEVGHFLYTQSFPKDIFLSGPFGPDYETIANDFAWWIYGAKYPNQKNFANEVVTSKKQEYFSSTCDTNCVETILKIKIK